MTSKFAPFILVLAVFFSILLTGCTSTQDSGFMLQNQSRLAKARAERKNPRVVYLGVHDDAVSNMNFGPKDISFEQIALR